MNIVLGIIFILVGLFSIAGAFFNWQWFINSRRARIFVNIMGQTGARIFYFILGLLILIIGILFVSGVIPLE